MPYINVSTSAKVNDKGKLLEEISILISSLTNKSRSFVMTKKEMMIAKCILMMRLLLAF